MSSSNNMVSAAPLPEGTAPLSKPGAVPDTTGRDIKAEQAQELAVDKAAATKKKNRFEVKPRTSVAPAPPSQPEYETLIYKTAVNNPPARLEYPRVSTYVPNFAFIFFLLNYMDYLMASTDKWTRNSQGWTPPLSQAYIGVLVYIQVIRCSISAGIADISMVSWYEAFCKLYPLKDLWIPGPLVAAFRAISAFEPTEDLSLGIVTPALPPAPGWSRARHYLLGNSHFAHLPNIRAFIDRHLTLSALAVNATRVPTEAAFFNDINGPLHRNSFFQVAPNSAILAALMKSPGMNFMTPGSFDLWKTASRLSPRLGLPTNLDQATTNVSNTWDAVMCLDQGHHWFGNVAAIMAKYCQFFNGSASLDSCSPTSSAAGALKLRIVTPDQGTSIFADAPETPQSGTHDNTQHGDANQMLHRTLLQSPTLVFDSQCAIKDMADLFLYAGGTWALNAHFDNANQLANRAGPFWDLGPNWWEDKGVQLAPGVLATVMREYHNDVRIPSHKQ